MASQVKNTSMTIMVPAYNEEKHIEKVTLKLLKSLKKYFKKYEVIIFDDCSKDKTYEITERLAKKYKEVKVVHNNPNKGIGYSYKKGIKLAKTEYFMYFPGDGSKEPVEHVLKEVGRADVLIPYIDNQKERSWIRRTISESYTNFINILFGLDVKYYNGFVVSKLKYTKKLHLVTDSFSLQTEVVVKLLKQGATYHHIPYKAVPQAKTGIFKLRNMIGVGKSIVLLFWNVKIRKKY
jgi:dolichol-phosphate mannosyltransferase